MNIVSPHIYVTTPCLKIDVSKGENNTFHFSSGWANPYHKIKSWSAYIVNHDIYEISTNSNEIRKCKQ